MGAQEVVLIAVNQRDVASTNQAEVLLEIEEWTVGERFEDHPVFVLKHLRMVFLPDGLLFEDHLDRRWENATGETVCEIIFPSRHVAASGKPSLTLHPIGVPHLPIGEQGPYGGHGGQPSPPSTRLASWWNMLLAYAPREKSVEGFELSFEVTHHGPTVSVPCLFIEVGSTEDMWGHLGAAKVLGHLIRDGLLGQAGEVWDPSVHTGALVVVTLGGGHYAPRASNLALIDGVWVGHMLANYALPFRQREDGDVVGNWRQSILAALAATRKAFPGGDVVCSMDKKAFRGWQRQAVRDFLEAEGVPLLTTKQIKQRLEQT